VDEDEVIGGAAAQFGGDAGSAAQSKLVGVDARLQTGGPAGAKPLDGFVRREDAAFAKHVAPLGQLFARDGRDHVFDQQVDVSAPPIAVLARNLVCAHAGGRQLD